MKIPMNSAMIRQGTIPFLFACANLALIAPGPALAAQAVKVAYHPFIYGYV